MTDNQTDGTLIPRSLFVYALIYGGLVVLAGVLGTKIAEIGPFGSLGALHVESGIFAFFRSAAKSEGFHTPRVPRGIFGEEEAEILDKLVRSGVTWKDCWIVRLGGKPWQPIFWWERPKACSSLQIRGIAAVGG
ncbi:hypothetical protein [Tabrizicola sp.]|uniref:hypothetical protein n=1 Tax=Tabrizicola sp. TaxID=2005166 RepID=UPI00286AB4EB|nr:hypothetical protein [Tabrizicola sp.]